MTHPSDSSLQDWLLAALTPGLGSAGILALIQAFGSIGAARRAEPAALRRHIRPAAAQALQQCIAMPAVEQALAWAHTPGAFLLTLQDADYPLALAQAPSPPVLLFGLGRRDLLASPMLAIVGSRSAGPQGCATAHDFAAALAEHGYTIVSGLASGIDGAAHRGALPYPASSVAVIGTGIDRVYPASHRDLARQLACNGLVLSEFPLGAGPLAQHFPRRNRIIAGLSAACLVVEASVESGSLITARQALDAGRDVMAIPGAIHHARARGCHRLIKDGAALIETVNDVLDQVGRLSATPYTPKAPDLGGHPLLDAIGADTVTLDELVARLGLTVAELYAILLQLELEGRVASLPGGRFQRIDPPPVESPL
ncbi:DNA-processing protein DprA [Paludibacterium purpuratum]|uniref:DNA protecting protein DprA n=1 Tax=Paludibacterium purpuratum TaxID=1144873 RepID=A0A4R7B8V2_9NEIS|nr:DNA-processing protein DprA [Paludibacterium purpuratum]TDR80362.1 DNA protecting protein DprA [Paludibacterium purpuratum]